MHDADVSGELFASHHIYKTNDLPRLTEVLNNGLQPLLLSSPDPRKVQATFNGFDTESTLVRYGRIEGKIFGVLAQTSSFFSVFLPLTNRIRVGSLMQLFPARPPLAYLALPGDIVAFAADGLSFAYVATNARSASLLRVLGTPHRLLKTVNRRATFAPSSDLRSLIGYLSSESDRLVLRTGEAKEVHLELLGQALGTYVCHLVDELRGVQPSPSAHRLSLCLEFDRAVRSHASQPVTVQHLAEYLACSPRNLYNAVETVCDCTPAAYQVRLRLIEARNRIVCATQPIENWDVFARRLGYSRPSQFAEDYYSEYGETPQEARDAQCAFLRSLGGYRMRQPSSLHMATSTPRLSK
ncbi:MAG: helix-turn-helix domain-containing protein [Fimbriimonadaceae bacterium]